MAHDYDPSWDYDIDEDPLGEVRKLVDEFVAAHAQVLAALELETPTVAYVNGLKSGGHLAKYASGTAPDLVIVLDSRYLVEMADEYGVRLEAAVESTLLHEYGHAYFDARGEREEMDPETEELVVEKFAHTYWETRDIEESMKVLAR